MKNLLNESLLDFNKAIELNPNFTDAFYNRANLYFLRNEYDKSWRDVEKIRGLGLQVSAQFLEKLKTASGRDK